MTSGAVARATPFGVKFGGLDGVWVGSRSKMGKLQSVAGQSKCNCGQVKCTVVPRGCI